MANLTSEEQETVITFDESPGKAIIFTFNKSWQRHLEKNLGLVAEYDNGYGGREYLIDKGRIKPPRAPRKLSAEQKKKAGERLQKYRQNPPNSSKSHLIQGKSGGRKKNVCPK